MIHILNGILTETFVRYDRKLLKSVLLFSSVLLYKKHVRFLYTFIEK